MAGNRAYLAELRKLWNENFVAAILTARLNHKRVPPETAAVAQAMDRSFRADRDLSSAVDHAMGSLGLSGGSGGLGVSSGIDPDEYMFNAAMGMIAAHHGNPPATPALQAQAAAIITGQIEHLAAFELASPQLAGTGLVSGVLSLAGEMAPLLQRMALFMAALAVPAADIPALLSGGTGAIGYKRPARRAPAIADPGGSYVSGPRTNALAIASIVLGLVSWVGPTLLASIPAIITGHMARRAIRDSSGAVGGQGLAVTGLVLGYANVVAAFIFLAILVIGLM
jgi:Domain of unknown function (DUF4190)